MGVNSMDSVLMKCAKGDEKYILDYIAEDIAKCPYLYLNLKKYGCDKDFVNAWYIKRSGGGISMVMLKYHSTLHLYGRERDFDASIVKDLINKIVPKMIFADKSTSDRLLIIRGYQQTVGVVEVAEERGALQNDDVVQKAEYSDLDQIAELICSEPKLNRGLPVEVVLRELRERYNDAFSRHYVIREGKEIISHCCTVAESDDFAIIGAVFTKDARRGEGYGAKVVGKMTDALIREGKKPLIITYENHLVNGFYKKLGFIPVCEWTRLLKV
jgi:predicted GNAT family acetyltransferase